MDTPPATVNGGGGGGGGRSGSRSGGRDPAPARAVGRAGEDLACSWYVASGFTVLERNWRCSIGEVDLICISGRTLVVCEVKARSTDRFGMPAESVGRAKQQRLRRLAACFLAERDLSGVAVRFDVASVLSGDLEMITDAF